MPVKTAINQFMRYAQRYAPTTQRRYRDTLCLFSAEMPDFLDEIVPEHLDRFIMRPGLSNNSRNVILSALRSFYAYLENYYGYENTAAKVKYLRKNPVKQNIITKQQYCVILEHARPCERAVIRFLANTGLRSSEFCDMQQVSASQELIRICGKGNKVRTVPLNKTARGCLSQIYYKQWNCDKLKWLCKKLSIKSGVHFYPHSLRHYFVTELVKKGVPVPIVSKIVGHSSPEITYRIYTHLTTPDTLGVTDCLD